MVNKYVDFVSDEDFLECVKHVIKGYNNYQKDIKPLNILKKSNNTIDEFKVIFDMYVNDLNFENWSKLELTRQNDKTVNNKIGEFHQMLLGKVDGWIDLGTGDESEVDLKKEDNTIFIELKNKYNTMNSSSSKTCRDKLKNIIKKYPNATTYWGYVISKNYKSIEDIWIKNNEEPNEQIRKISGKKLYELVTGDSNALEKTFNAIPLAINDILEKDFKLNNNNEKILEEFKEYVFKIN